MTTHAFRFVPLLLWIAYPALVFFLQRDESSLSSFLENKTILLTLYSVFIAGPLWVAYGRLNNLDSSDSLKPAQALAVNNFAFSAKKLLLKYFSLSIALILAVVFIVIANASFPIFNNWPKVIAISGALVFFAYAVIRVVDILLQTERTLRSVNAWKAEQKERNKQVTDLRRARAEKKLVPDENLLRYREFVVGEREVETGPEGKLPEIEVEAVQAPLPEDKTGSP